MSVQQVRMAITALLVACATTLTCTHTASAATYDVTFASAGAAGWSSRAADGFAVDGWMITAPGSVAAASAADLVLQSDTPALRITRAQFTVHASFADAGMEARATYGATGDVAALSAATGTHDLSVDVESDTVAVGLHATTFATAGSTLQLLGAHVTFDDQRAPIIAHATAAADPTGCTRVSVTASDAESGLDSITLTDRRTLTTLGSWIAPRSAGMHPGATSTQWSPCINPITASAMHFLDVDVADVAGAHAHTTVTEIPSDAAAPRPAATLQLAAPSTGGSSVTLDATASGATLQAETWALDVDGRAAAISGDAARARAVIDALAPGAHELSVRVLAADGHTLTATRTYVVDHIAGVSSAELATAQRAIPDSATGTQIVVLRAMPAVVTAGAHMSIRVLLIHDGRIMRDVAVRLRRNHGTIAAARSDASGVATLAPTITAPGAYAITSSATAKAKPLSLHVAPRIVWSTRASRARYGAVATLRGTVAPASACRSITLSARRGAGWFVVRGGIRCVRGAFSVPITANARGTFQLRAATRPSSSWSAGLSNTRLLRVA